MVAALWAVVVAVAACVCCCCWGRSSSTEGDVEGQPKGDPTPPNIWGRMKWVATGNPVPSAPPLPTGGVEGDGEVGGRRLLRVDPRSLEEESAADTSDVADDDEGEEEDEEDEEEGQGGNGQGGDGGQEGGGGVGGGVVRVAAAATAAAAASAVGQNIANTINSRITGV